jgi:ADP-ribose pyrophosphatase YjhB (NUDIX family)
MTCFQDNNHTRIHECCFCYSDTMKKIIGTVCFFVQDTKVLLAEIEYPDGKKLWNGVGGVVDNNETPLEGVIREISEETMLRVDENGIDEATVINLRGLELHVFIAHEWSGELIALDPTLKRFRWFEFNQIPYGQMLIGNDAWLPGILDKANKN